MIINRFEGEYAFLSNFYPSPFMLGDYLIKTVEHGYQAGKAREGQNFYAIQILEADTPALAKKLGRKLELREDWESEKVAVMITLCLAKFHHNPELLEKLVATGDAELIEGNWWGDTFWGVCNGEGQNHLGRILMSIRDEEIYNRELEADGKERFLKYPQDYPGNPIQSNP